MCVKIYCKKKHDGGGGTDQYKFTAEHKMSFTAGGQYDAAIHPRHSLVLSQRSVNY